MVYSRATPSRGRMRIKRSVTHFYWRILVVPGESLTRGLAVYYPIHIHTHIYARPGEFASRRLRIRIKRRDNFSAGCLLRELTNS